MRKVLVVVMPTVACAMSCLALMVADLLPTDGVLRDGMELIRKIGNIQIVQAYHFRYHEDWMTSVKNSLAMRQGG